MFPGTKQYEGPDTPVANDAVTGVKCANEANEHFFKCESVNKGDGAFMKADGSCNARSDGAKATRPRISCETLTKSYVPNSVVDLYKVVRVQVKDKKADCPENYRLVSCMAHSAFSLNYPNYNYKVEGNSCRLVDCSVCDVTAICIVQEWTNWYESVQDDQSKNLRILKEELSFNVQSVTKDIMPSQAHCHVLALEKKAKRVFYHQITSLCVFTG